jgi:hypothetical protein
MKTIIIIIISCYYFILFLNKYNFYLNYIINLG